MSRIVGPDETGDRVVEGTVERVTFESATSSFRVIKLAVEGRAGWLPVVGSFPPATIGARVRVRGFFESDPKHGEQLRAESVIELAPETLAGLERYLASGLIKGVGPKLARRIVAAFGLASLGVLDEHPERLREVEGLGEKRRLAIARAWREQRVVREVMVFLQAHGASPALAARIVRRYGPRAMGVVARDPYRLALDVRGVGFKTADRIASTLGVEPDSPHRMQAAVWQTMHDLTDAGHVWTGERELVVRSLHVLALPEADGDIQARVGRAIDALVASARLVAEGAADGARVGDAAPVAVGGASTAFTGGAGGDRRLYAAEVHAAEVRVANRLRQLAAAPARVLGDVDAALRDFESRADVELADEQRRAVQEAARRQVLVITGGPGVGKTTIVKAILATMARASMAARLAAPTGRAAKRMAEATGAQAATLHRLLEFDPKSATFKRDHRRPLDGDAVIVDEASMIDLAMADALTDAIAPGTRLVLVGDVDQLPSVGPGAVLRDVIASSAIACVRLRQIFRQAARSRIVVNAHRINEGELPLPPPRDRIDDSDFFVVERNDPERARDTIVELITARIPHRFGLDPLRDIQVLTPMNRGPAGAVALNAALQAALNPSGPALVHGARSFRLGDKVMQLRNDYERGIFNGDIGFVTAVDDEDHEITVRFDDREVPFEAADLDDLVLAYACTVHKAQGSEYPAVVLPLLTTHFVMLSKNLLYTAVTRGKRLVVLVSDPRALELALSRHRHEERRTTLAARLAAAGGPPPAR